MANDAASVLAVARGELGYSRWDDPSPGTKYGRWYEASIDRTSGDYDFGASGVPYCAMFVSWVFAQVGASCAGIPGAYCPSIVAAGRSRGKAVAPRDIKPGDAVLYDWEGDGVSDHIGIAELNTGSHIQAIEGTTNNGRVARRTRSYGSIVCGIRPDYDGASAPAPSGESGCCAVDGFWGPATSRAVQGSLGTEVDGIVSDQYAPYASSNPGLLPSSWEWHSRTTLGSDMVRALQRKVGAEIDGIAGPKTIRALQRHLGTVQDGVVSSPSACVKELQRRLNAGAF